MTENGLKWPLWRASSKAIVFIANRSSKFCWIAYIINDNTSFILLGQAIQPRATPARTTEEPLVNLYLPAAEKQLSVVGDVQFWIVDWFTHKSKSSSRHEWHWVVFMPSCIWAVEIKRFRKKHLVRKRASLNKRRTSITRWEPKTSTSRWRN